MVTTGNGGEYSTATMLDKLRPFIIDDDCRLGVQESTKKPVGGGNFQRWMQLAGAVRKLIRKALEHVLRFQFDVPNTAAKYLTTWVYKQGTLFSPSNLYYESRSGT